jgi:hypothetical protein
LKRQSSNLVFVCLRNRMLEFKRCISNLVQADFVCHCKIPLCNSGEQERIDVEMINNTKR